MSEKKSRDKSTVCLSFCVFNAQPLFHLGRSRFMLLHSRFLSLSSPFFSMGFSYISISITFAGLTRTERAKS